MTERVTRAELLSFRRELLESIPVALRERLNDIDHLLGWPPEGDQLQALKSALASMVDLVEAMGVDPVRTDWWTWMPILVGACTLTGKDVPEIDGDDSEPVAYLDRIDELTDRVAELEQALGDLWGAAKRVVEREHVDNADGVTWMGLLHNQAEAGRAILAKGLG